VNIELHIEQLVLNGNGLEQRDGTAFQEALEMELTRLLETGAFDTIQGTHLSSLRTESLQTGLERNPNGIGTGVARAVIEGIGEGKQ
jgi:hypothetical protein